MDETEKEQAKPEPAGNPGGRANDDRHMSETAGQGGTGAEGQKTDGSPEPTKPG